MNKFIGPPQRPRAAYKTYSHLLAQRRAPGEYDLATSRLHYYLGRGFEISTPLEDWYRRHQQGSPLAAGDWEQFRDPRETTYTRYTALQRDREVFLDGILQSIEDSGYDRRLDPGWVATLEQVLGPLRYPLHGLQMVAAYVGQMGPGGRITIAAMLQAADEVRRIQRIACRLAQLRLLHPGLCAESKRAWQEDPRWQPLRRLIEQLLITYDWGEALVALNLGVKPLLDDLVLRHLPALAAGRGDPLLGEICASLYEDCRWHRQWTAALLRLALAEDGGDGQAAVQRWLDRWQPQAAQAVAALSPFFGDAFPDVAAALGRAGAALPGELGLTAPPLDFTPEGAT